MFLYQDLPEREMFKLYNKIMQEDTDKYFQVKHVGVYEDRIEFSRFANDDMPEFVVRLKSITSIDIHRMIGLVKLNMTAPRESTAPGITPNSPLLAQTRDAARDLKLGPSKDK